MTLLRQNEDRVTTNLKYAVHKIVAFISGMARMDILFGLACAALLAMERMTYWYAWTRPRRFAARMRRLPGRRGADPVAALKSLFHVFKLIQVAVLFGWCAWFAGSWILWPTAPLPILLLGVGLIAFGQVLNFGVMIRLGSEGVFYGNRFGRNVPWQTGFPFSLTSHPQYVGALLSVWGFMLAMRFPHADWVLLPLLSTVYYALGARLER